MMHLKKFLVTITTLLAFCITPALADEPDTLPKDQQACYEQAPNVTRMEIVGAEPDPTVNWNSHYLNNESGRELSALSYITPQTTVVKLFSGITVSDFVKIHDDLMKMKDYSPELRDVTLVINSPGGSAFDGLSIASLILKARNEWGFTIRAQGYGIIASAAVPVLAVCQPRYVAPGTLIMVHEAALWKWPGRETQSDIKSQDKLMDLLAERYNRFLTDHTTTDLDTWKSLIKATTWMSPEQGKELGLVDEVR